ncbi:MAG: molybdopterin-synthase adenylyltransferase MoeB [Thermoanaerobaculia bacterium]|nr:molybdopterin-synthase adenylyltransferase MoeB [Thermoanaerobaculia bacterium]
MLSNDELQRYARHISLPEMGVEGQERLRAGSVLVVGAGGLGSPAALYLTAAGVGTIGLVEFDRLDISNLQRQILFDTPSVGKPKLETAVRRLRELNPSIEIVPHELRLTSANALDVLRPYDVVLDASDNFPTRYLVNDAAVLLGKPNVYGSIFRFVGQASVFWPPKGPCYRCMYTQPPPPGLVPSCEEGGVLGVVPGLVGVIQAAEAIKVLLGRGELLVGRMLLIDLMRMSFRELRVPRNPECVVCGPNPSVRELVDYEAFCGTGASRTEPEVTPRELDEILRNASRPRLIDVREPMEWQTMGHIAGADLMPLRDLPSRLDELTAGDEIVCYCASGVRSAHAAKILRDAGFARTRNLAGGIRRWVEEGLPVER